jgi:hypothetical protein
LEGQEPGDGAGGGGASVKIGVGVVHVIVKVGLRVYFSVSNVVQLEDY